ncbi:DNA-binding protein [Burkholderia cepacia]|uniref:DNA-binding protein n=1 Tax=Burkholderia cepacia TaxID=292 RepID=UPI00075B4849|nr:DNA-binding protein [Burkholderia cepacia]KWF95616.1 DNA-binding protein [Burkholderia cepacia]MBZ5794720.1 DNA-binding protein [Burkholderia contaminans]
MTTTQIAARHMRRLLTTEELASLLSLRPQSIRKRYCQTGAYFTLRPVKLPNGRLMWPADAVEKLAEGI